MTGNLFDIVRGSVVDGPGIRTTVFFKGCNLRCKWCHNPESQRFQREILFYETRCKKCGRCERVCPTHLKGACTACGKCAQVCPADARQVCGREWTKEEVLDEIFKDIPFYEASGGGVTFSGGECVLQADFLAGLLKSCKEKNIHTAVDTAGNVPFAEFEKLIPYTDLFLYDIKAMTSELHEELTGADNALIKENFVKLLAREKKVTVRIPVVTGANDSTEEMTAICDFLKAFAPINVELLPYHRLGEGKYDALKRATTVYEMPSEEKMRELNGLFACVRPR